MSKIEDVARAIWAERVRCAAEEGIHLEAWEHAAFDREPEPGQLTVALINNIYGEARAAIAAMRDEPETELPYAFITCTSANPDYFVTIKTRNLKDAQRWHQAVLDIVLAKRTLAKADGIATAAIDAALEGKG